MVGDAGFEYAAGSLSYIHASVGTFNPTIRTLLLCDLVASTQLVERVGDSTTSPMLGSAP